MWCVFKFFTFVVSSTVPVTRCIKKVFLDNILVIVCVGKQICVQIILFVCKSLGQVEDNVSIITGLLCLIGEFPKKLCSP